MFLMMCVIPVCNSNRKERDSSRVWVSLILLSVLQFHRLSDRGRHTHTIFNMSDLLVLACLFQGAPQMLQLLNNKWCIIFFCKCRHIYPKPSVSNHLLSVVSLESSGCSLFIRVLQYSLYYISVFDPQICFCVSLVIYNQDWKKESSLFGYTPKIDSNIFCT